MEEDAEGPYQMYNKKVSEMRHRFIHRLLTREFPDCVVSYDGQQGHDHCIQLKNYTLFLETKTCEPIIKTGRHYAPKDRPVIFDVPRLGRFKFDKRTGRYPYIVSQHDDLVRVDGWYIFLVDNDNGRGRKIVSGIKASELMLTKTPNIQRIAWGVVLAQCHPDWLQRLKYQIYSTVVRRAKLKKVMREAPL